MREKQQVAREQERQRHRTIESYCQDVLKRQEEFEHKVREHLALLGGIGVECCSAVEEEMKMAV